MKEIALIGFVQTIFYSLLLLVKKQKKAHDYLLIVFILFVGAELLYRHLLLLGYEADNRWLVLFDTIYWALFGPVTLFYYMTIVGKVRWLKNIHAIHLIPLLVSLLSVAGFLSPHTASQSFIDYFNNSNGLTKVGLNIWEYTSPLYLLYVFLLLRKHNRSVKNHYSNVSGRDLRWLTMLVFGMLVYCLASYLLWFTESLFNFEFGISPLYILPGFLTLYVFFVGFYGFRQGPIVFASSAADAAQSRHADHKYSKSGLHDGERKALVSGLKKLMEEEKPYLDNDLTITHLAVKLNTNLYKLSQVINESLNQTFYDLINSYRIEESKRLLQGPEAGKYTITSIAQDAGFTSKSAFYSAFRRKTGMTPGEYMERMRVEAI